MGKYIHVVKKQRKFGETEAFNWGQEDFKAILVNLGCYVYEPDGYSDDFEVPVTDYKNAINILKQWIKNGKGNVSVKGMVNNDGDDVAIDLDSVGDVLTNIFMTNDKLLVIMLAFYKERDKKSDWIQFSAW